MVLYRKDCYALQENPNRPNTIKVCKDYSTEGAIVVKENALKAT